MAEVQLSSTRSKLGDSLSQISQLTRLTVCKVKETLEQNTGLTAEELSIILHMKLKGKKSIEQISQEVKVITSPKADHEPRHTRD